MTGAPPPSPGRRRSPAAPALASLLLHGAALAALAVLHMQDRLPDTPPERGVEIVWQDSPEDAAPGAGAEAPAEASEAPDRELPTSPPIPLADSPVSTDPNA